ncbi:MAG TPA: zinc-binding alcohol dehydrogenase family protein [Chthonomonas sp.]|uniref:zinc-binding alcohol dehydrogenase family protein n=1 Tax=Chthonomonas sp. TaxID=2282153 RepID=UPI002B4B3FA5|nr:zinc-binding alcohol dehydrogenase family protein [Chthonomonas sp.]HLH79788.1 zinc-binding alcohol dehydrogenase family protein [Chthonomonas sp.]
MRAFIMDAPRQARIGEWPTPEPKAGEVRVAVVAAGICAGDIYIYKGVNPYVVYPAIGGHEIAGVVESVGANVEGLHEGDAVVVEPFLGCGACYPCRQGRSNCCTNLQILGAHRPGGYAEFIVAPATHIHKVPEGLSLFQASFAEPVAIGVHGCRRGDVKPGEYVLILGCGPIGLALIEVARAYGAHVVATDTNPERAAFAAKLGATILPAENLLETVREQTNGEGAPVVMEATGNPKAMEMTVDLVASAGRIVILGLVKQGTTVNLPALDFTRKEMTFLGSRASVNYFPEALRLLASGQITYPRVATAFSMWEAPQVFADLTEHPSRVHKGVLTIPEEVHHA